MPDNNETIACPDCHGSGAGFAFIDVRDRSGKPFGRSGQISCLTCRGDKTVNKARWQRLQILRALGIALRDDRVNRGVTSREEAARLGISIWELRHRESPRYADMEE